MEEAWGQFCHAPWKPGNATWVHHGTLADMHPPFRSLSFCLLFCLALTLCILSTPSLPTWVLGPCLLPHLQLPQRGELQR